MVRELERKLPAGVHADQLALFKKALAQKRNDTNKIYSLHEPHVQCISKGKEHKKYEFGSKVSIITTKKSGVIIGALNIEKNDYDSGDCNWYVIDCVWSNEDSERLEA